MTTHRFYVPDIESGAGRATLSRDQSRQISRVLRMRPGDQVTLFDGRGREYLATLTGLIDDCWETEVSEGHEPEREPKIALTVGLSLIRNERFELAVQKLTELGVSTIAPVIAERCVISYKDQRSWQKRRSRLMRIIIEAAEQSERATLPTLDDPMTITEFLEGREPEQTLALVERRLSTHINEVMPLSGEVSLVIGPEGGWTEEEITLIQQHSTSVHLGELILRSETAAITATSFLIFQEGTSESRSK